MGSNPTRGMDIVCCECRVLSGRGLCDELITRPEESYRLCCVVVCDLETSRVGAPYIYDISTLRVKDIFNIFPPVLSSHQWSLVFGVSYCALLTVLCMLHVLFLPDVNVVSFRV